MSYSSSKVPEPGAGARRRRPRKGEQLALPRTGGRGGRRSGAGRKPTAGKRSNVAHAKRPVHKGRHPVHVTLRARSGLPSFRQQLIHMLIAAIIRKQRSRSYAADFRILHFSIQRNHLHLIVEADTERAAGRYSPLRAGISGLEISFARRLNALLGQSGPVWADRYHRHDLRTPRESWNGHAYLFHNHRHHGTDDTADSPLDPHASGWMFDGWDGPTPALDEDERWMWPVCAARSWLASRGVLVHGPVPLRP